jgi:O-antigen/teichoic acid export membrane protein
MVSLCFGTPGPMPDSAGGPPSEEGEGLDIRAVAMSGGAYLLMRELLGMLIRLGGVIVVARMIGPANYGIYVGTSAFVAILALAAQFGAEVWLIRQPVEPTLELYQQVWTCILIVSVCFSGLAIALSYPAALFVPHDSLLPFRILVISIPFNVLWAPAQAKIERAFGYRKMAWLELVGDLALYGAALPLALLGAGVYSLVTGYIAWQVTLLVGSSILAHLPPRIRWSKAVAKDLLSHGSSYAATGTVGQLSTLVNPILVGYFAGPAAVGFVGLAGRLVDTAGFAMRTTYRLALVMMNSLRDDAGKLRSAVGEGLSLQLIAMGAPMAALAIVAREIVPLLWGSQWRPAVALYGVFALGQLLTSLGQVPMVYLLSEGRNVVVFKAAFLNVLVLFACATAAVPFLGGMGLALATLAGALGWAVTMDMYTRREIGFSYKESAPWLLMFSSLVLFPVWSFPWCLFLLAPSFVVLAASRNRLVLTGYLSYAVRGLRSRFT